MYTVESIVNIIDCFIIDQKYLNTTTKKYEINRNMRRLLNKMKLIFLATLILTSFLSLQYYLLNFKNTNEEETETFIIDEQKQAENFLRESDFVYFNYSNQSLLKLFDLKRKLEPSDKYDSINCRKLAFKVKTTVCVHETRDDVHVSDSTKIIHDSYKKFC